MLVTYLVGIHHILPVLIKAEDGDRYQLALRTIYHSLPLRPLPLTYFAHSAMKCKLIDLIYSFRLNRSDQLDSIEVFGIQIRWSFAGGVLSLKHEGKCCDNFKAVF